MTSTRACGSQRVSRCVMFAPYTGRFAGPLCGGAIASQIRVRATVSANAETTPTTGRRRGPAMTTAASAERHAENAVQPGSSERRQGSEREEASRRGAGEVHGIETARAARRLAKAPNDDPTCEHQRQRAGEVCDENRSRKRDARVDVRLEEERREGA